ncbi:unnamed protein product [Symbiodinium sp. CCMP2592]|nr:unnamed protein product [Symbiodinium sp. CCMP2592]
MGGPAFPEFVPKTGHAVLEVQQSDLARVHKKLRTFPSQASETVTLPHSDIAELHKKLRGMMKEMGGPAFPEFVPKTGHAVLEVQQSDLARVHKKLCTFPSQASETVTLPHSDIAELHKKLRGIMQEMGGPTFPAFVPKKGDAVLEVQQSELARVHKKLCNFPSQARLANPARAEVVA